MPSKSNIADPPSRGITDIPLLVGAEDVTMLAKQCLLEIIPWTTQMGRRLRDNPQIESMCHAVAFESGSTNNIIYLDLRGQDSNSKFLVSIPGI